MGARTSGNGLDELVRRCYGVDTIEASINAAVHAPITVAPHAPRPTMWQSLSTDRTGRLRSVGGLDAARALLEIVDLQLFVSPGDEVRAHDNVADKLGWALLSAPSTSELRAAADRLLHTLTFEVDAAMSPAP